MAGELLGIRVKGIRDFARALGAFAPAYKREMTRLNRDFATRVAATARAEYGRHYPKAGAKDRRRRRSRSVTGIASRASSTSASIALGASGRHWLIGQEFGSNRYKQFAPWTGPAPEGGGSAGRFLYPTIREETPKLVEEYGDALQNVARDAFPDGVSL